MSYRISTKLAVLAAVAMVFCVLLAGAASAQTDPYGEGKPDVLGTIISNGEPGEEPGVLADTTSDRPGTVAGETQGAVLPFTGGQVTMFVVLGAGAVILGTFIVRKTKTTA